MRYLIAASLSIAIFGSAWFSVKFPGLTDGYVIAVFHAIESVQDQVAAVILSRKPKSVEYLHSKYGEASKEKVSKVRILIVPGHEPSYGGAEFMSQYGEIKERDLVVVIAWHLARYLQSNPRYEVLITRDSRVWHPDFQSYFDNSWEEINAWRQANKDDVMNLATIGAYKQLTPEVVHVDARHDVAMRLYGINKWVNDNDIDIALHLHLNDNPGHAYDEPGKHSGFSMYVPEKQYFNSTTSKAIADTLFRRLKMYNATSDYPGEKAGIIEDQELIAVGSYNSVDAPSILLEYGYIYEPQFTDTYLRELSLKDLAYQTYLGIEDFFKGTKGRMAALPTTAIFPYKWNGEVNEANVTSPDIFALQSALATEGLYPPASRESGECPRTGKFGPCTRESLSKFQKMYGIEGEEGRLGAKTIELLNLKYGR